MLRDFFTRNIGFKLTALALAAALWFVARFWLIK